MATLKKEATHIGHPMYPIELLSQIGYDSLLQQAGGPLHPDDWEDPDDLDEDREQDRRARENLMVRQLLMEKPKPILNRSGAAWMAATLSVI